MHVVIGGYGRVGRYLARMLEYEGHTVAVVDHDPAVFETLGKDINGSKFVGQIFDRATLEKAGIRKADVFCAVTSGDNSNILGARVAKEYYEVPRVVARIYDPRRAEIYAKFGIPTVASVTWASARLLQLVAHPELRSEYQFGNGEISMLEFEAPATLVGRTVSELGVPGEIDVVCVVRGNAARMPFPELAFEAGDHVFCNVTRESLEKFESLVGLR
jgi:trk system potassium uptake protein TrkA